MKLKSSDILRWNIFNSYNIKTGITTRNGGVSSYPYKSLNLAKHTGDRENIVDQNRKIFTEFIESDIKTYTHGTQVHGDNIIQVTEDIIGSKNIECDALITDIPGVLLNIFVADCVPIVIYDLKKSIGGLCHCGWKGTIKQLLTKTVTSLTETYDSNIEDLLVGIGPSIGMCCYNVSKELYYNFNPIGNEGVIKNGEYYLNLKEINKKQALSIGIPCGNIEVMDICTSCNNENFFSYRKEGEPSGRFSAFLEIIS